MNWFLQFLRSSIGRKIIMSLTGLFLILFLIVHLIGNLQLLYDDGGAAFNTYAHFMSSNPLIKTISIGLYLFIVLHTIQGIVISLSNRKAKGQKYAVSTNASSSWASKNMLMLGLLIFAFLAIHLGDFWFKMRFTDQLASVTYEGSDHAVSDLYERVYVAFKELWIVIVYVIGMIALAVHLQHGFQSAFQSLGWNHKKYTPLIKFLGLVYAIIVPLGFAVIPIWIYLI